jgi:ABC-type transport system involved in multi-copper enzyme maturation permease subunit
MPAILPGQEQSPPPAKAPTLSFRHWVDDQMAGVRRRRGGNWAAMAAGYCLGLAASGGLWLASRPASAVIVLGCVGLVAAAWAGVSLLRRMLTAGHPVIAVARAIVEEALGGRLGAVLAVLVLIGLPALPFVLDPAERLAYRLQFFLTWSLSAAFAVLAVLTIALCCGTVCNDISTSRIHLTLTKPLQRWEYLLGKWVGVVMLNLLLVTLLGIGAYATAAGLRRTPASDAADVRAVEEQVWTARVAARPIHPKRDEFDTLVANEIERVRNEDPALFDKDPDAAADKIKTRMVYAWHTVTADVVASYLFTGLEDVKRQAAVVQLRVEPFADNSSTTEAQVQFAMWLNERPFPVKEGKHEDYVLAASRVHTLEIPTVAISDEGTLLITIANRNLVMPGELGPTSIGFKPGKGLELLHRVGGFEGNLVRALIVMLAKLAMLAAVALAAGSWLSLPIAMLASMMVFVAAIASGFVADAIDIYTGVDDATPTFVSMVRLRAGILWEFLLKFEWWNAAKAIGAYCADAFLALIPAFSSYDSITEAATGRLVSTSATVSAILLLMLVYPAVLLAIGWAMLERRDLVSTSS